ncbi:transposase [Schaalia sp. Marseille-Q2122]|uniref:transposase n=1 Tax=Schaalia sp. Marseille-Q2122 TaxID=2736604 RepID=UPI00158F5A81|nr:transposase [Schaalia sp. Marseille-Q2122]
MSSLTSSASGGRSRRRRYAQEFKDDAVRMVIELGKPIAQVARDLDVNEGTLGHWVALWRDAHPGQDRALDVSERRAWEADRRALAELKMENEFLKKAGAFFAATHQS